MWTCFPQRQARKHWNIKNTALEKVASEFCNNKAYSAKCRLLPGCLRCMAVLGHSITATANER